MNRYVVFENPGVLDPRTIRTFGLSVKESENPIGFFGTGMKYAIAILMREGCFAAIIAGGTNFLFETKKQMVRGKEFNMITMNGEELPFTTHLGVNWQPWQAFREIYCNALDEKGKVYMAEEMPEPNESKTFFVVSGGPFEQLYFERDKIVIRPPEKTRLHTGEVDIFNLPSECIYYRGIRVFDFKKPALYTYSVNQDMQLTEDRTLKHPSVAYGRITHEIAKMTDRVALRKILTAKDGTAESEFSFLDLKYYDWIMTPEFKVVLAEEFHANNDSLNNTARELFKKLEEKESIKNLTQTETTNVEDSMLKRAKDCARTICKTLDDYPIIVVESLGQKTLAMADMDNKKIVLSKPLFKMGTKYVTLALIEEYTHLFFGHLDCTREMQTHLFETITSMVEQHIIGEPI